jgi:uncharacterized membrane protein (DUF441 family)
MWAHLLPYFRYGFVVGCVLLATAVLFPIFWYTWIYNSGGNSNFVYAVSLVFDDVFLRVLAPLLTIASAVWVGFVVANGVSLNSGSPTLALSLCACERV